MAFSYIISLFFLFAPLPFVPLFPLSCHLSGSVVETLDFVTFLGRVLVVVLAAN